MKRLSSLRSLAILILLGFGLPLTSAQTAGSLDLSYGNQGRTNVGDRIFPISAVEADNGSVVVAGFKFPWTEFPYLNMFDSSGKAVSAFDPSEITDRTDLGSIDDITVDASGKLVMYCNKGFVIRVHMDGSLDTTFGDKGFTRIHLFDTTKSAWKNAEQTVNVIKTEPLSGHIFLGGSVSNTSDRSRPVIACLKDDGSINRFYGNNGISEVIVKDLDTQYVHNIYDLIAMGNGKVIGIGNRDFPSLNWDSDYWACRLHKDGSPDGTFNNDGVAVFNGSFNGNDVAKSAILNPNGSFIFAGGGYTTTLRYDFTIQELTSGGSIGTLAFKSDFGTGREDIAEVIIKDDEGRLLIIGNSDSEVAMCRFSSSGDIDEGFGNSGRVLDDKMECVDALIDDRGRIIVVGSASNGLIISRYLGESKPQLDDIDLIWPAQFSRGVEFDKIEFSWDEAFLATGYEFVIDSSQGFSESPITRHTTGTTVELTDLTTATTYFWKVRAYTQSDTGTWSPIWDFTTDEEQTGSVAALNSERISIYPNPAKTELIVEMPQYDVRSYLIYSNLGNLIQAGGLQRGRNVIDFNGLVPGVYHLQIENAHHRLIISKP